MQDSQNNSITLEEKIKTTQITLYEYLEDRKVKEIYLAQILPHILKYIPYQFLLYFVSTILIVPAFDTYWKYLCYSGIAIFGYVQIDKFGIIYTYFSTRFILQYGDVAEKLQELELEKELRDSKNSEEREAIMTRKHYLHLEKYYRQSLSQSSWIFYFGIFMALFGLATIPLIVYFKFDNAVVLSTIQSILTAFVLVIFQTMYTKTSDSLTEFYKGLLKSYTDNKGEPKSEKVVVDPRN